MLACSAARALALSLLEARGGQGVDGPTPLDHDVMWEGRWAIVLKIFSSQVKKLKMSRSCFGCCSRGGYGFRCPCLRVLANVAVSLTSLATIVFRARSGQDRVTVMGWLWWQFDATRNAYNMSWCDQGIAPGSSSGWRGRWQVVGGSGLFPETLREGQVTV